MAARAIVIVAMSAMTLLGAMRAFYTDTSTTTDDTHLTAKTTLEREFGLATEITPKTSPSDIKLILTPIEFNSLTIKSCLGLFRTHAVNLLGEIFFALASNSIFFFTPKS